MARELNNVLTAKQKVRYSDLCGILGYFLQIFTVMSFNQDS